MTETYDYIVVGAGAAGCVVAERLSADPSNRVLVLDAGRERRSPLLGIPAAETILMGKPKYDWCYTTEPDETIDGRAVAIPRGRVLGGSNAINGMIFVRGQREDFDDWERLGNSGWGWNDVRPYFERLETYRGQPSEGRGTAGNTSVSLPRERDRLTDAFLAAALQLGYPANVDYNSGRQEGFGYYQLTQRDGRRSSALKDYLSAARRRPNVRVVTQALVTRLRLDGNECRGVEYRIGDRVQVADVGKEVIVCAGVVQSPQLLELSGIGSPEVLANVGIPLCHALPGVGENFIDHYAARMRWRVTLPITFNDRTRGARLLREGVRYLASRRGVLSLPIALGHGFVCSELSPQRPDIQFHFSPASYGDGSSRRLDKKPGMTVGIYPLRPRSRGSIHLRSRDPLTPPAIRPRFLSDASDVATLVAGVRIARRIIQSPEMDRYRHAELLPGDGVESAEDIVEYVRSHGDTSYHPVGTCRIGTDSLAVVDPRLRVHGIARLRIVDGSVMPQMISGNTNAATLMIAEKGAAMIREDDAERAAVTLRARS